MLLTLYIKRKRIIKSGAQIEQDVLEGLKWESAVSAELIGFEVKEGIVTLIIIDFLRSYPYGY